MSTFDEFVEATVLYLSGFTANRDQVTSLTNPMTDSDLTATVDDASAITAGSLVEIGSELLSVKSVDSGTDTVTFHPFGRGFRGTTAATHSVGSMVSVAPVFPRTVVERAINDTILGTYPQVFGVSTTVFEFVGAQGTYPLPAGTQGVLSVTWDSIGPTQEWLPVRRWTMNGNADTTDFPTGASISLFDGIVPGRNVKVVYTHQPSRLVSGDVFTDSGLRDAAQDLVQFGVAARLVPWIDAAQAPGVSAEANYAAGMGRQSNASALSRFFTQMYQLRLQEEAGALQALYPIRSHYTR